MPSLTEEQQSAIQSIDKHVLVSAGAGSGKTFVLVERYIKVLESNPQAGINDIIAVTYTKKAAEEMRSRLKSRLKELVEKSEGEQGKRWIKCLAELESARIGTIHSLCDSILKTFPAEAGIDPNFEILDELERAELLAQSIDDALHMIIDQPVDQYIELLDYPVESIRGWVADFLRSPLKYRESMKRFGNCSIDDMRLFAAKLIADDIERSLRELLSDSVFKAEMSYLIDTPWSDRESKLGLLQNQMLSHLHVIADTTLGIGERWQAVTLLSSMESAKNAGGPSAKEMRDCMRIIRTAVSKLAMRHKSELNDADQRSFLLIKALIELSNDALSRYERIKQQHQKLDFDDLIERCQQLLSGENYRSSFALRQLCKTLQAILVDEFQDTNWTQAKMLTALATNKAHLFLIGDDKQSIYKFQGADVGTFNACKTYISSMTSETVDELRKETAENYNLPLLAGTGEEMTLSMSFRSHPQIVNFVNHIFSTLFELKRKPKPLAKSGGAECTGAEGVLVDKLTMQEGDVSGESQMEIIEELRFEQSSLPQVKKWTTHQVEGSTAPRDDFKSQFQALRPARAGEEEEMRVDVIYTPAPDEDELDQRAEIDRLEAEQTALWIKDKVESGVEVFDKERGVNRALKYSDFAVLLQANGDFAGIEAALSKEAIPFVSIAGSGFLERQEVFDLENLLKWLICPQDSHALFAVLRSPLIGFSDDILHELKAGKSTSLWQCLLLKSQEAGQEELRAARRLLQDLHRDSGRLSLPDILRKAVLVTGYDIVLLTASSGKQKSRNVWKFLALASQHKHMGVAEFLKALESMRELGVKNLTDAPLCADDAVKIMTIHRSKGLEFAAVALPRLARGVLSMPRKVLFGKDFAIAFDCTRDSEEEKPAFYIAANNLNKRMDEEEKKRLLYVALTRARDFLGLFVNSRCKRGVNFGKWLISSLDLPEPDCEVDNFTMSAGFGSERCNWNVIQAVAPQPVATAEAEVLPVVGNSLAVANSFLDEFPEFTNDSLELARESALVFETLDVSKMDLSLLDDNLLTEHTYNPVPWQALLRACPNDPTPTVHATIAGNYFHLLMQRLGPGLELPSENERRNLLLHHEVSISDESQQELMLRESERLLLLFSGSKLHNLMRNARRTLFEHSYTIVRDGKEKDFRPDLLIEDVQGQWHIVDFKTDQFDVKHISKQVKSHHSQLATYVDDLATLLGIHAKAWLYFAHHGRLEAVDMASPFQLSLFPL